VVGCCNAAAIAAAVPPDALPVPVAEALGALALADGAEVEPELEHAASAAATVRPATVLTTVLESRERGDLGIGAPFLSVLWEVVTRIQIQKFIDIWN